MKTKRVLVGLLFFIMFYPYGSNAQTRELKIENDGFRWYELRDDRWHKGAEDALGHVIIPLDRQYQYLHYFDGCFCFEKEGKKGVCDQNGKEVFPPKNYKYVYYHNDYGFEYYIVESSKGKTGCCDKNGFEIIPTKYDYVWYNSDDGYFKIENKNKYGVCDKNGTLLIKPKYKWIDYSSKDNVFEYRDRSGKRGVIGISLIGIGPQSNMPSESEGEILHKNSNGFYWYEIELNGYSGALDVNGDTLISPHRLYDTIIYQKTSGGWFLVKSDGKSGLCNRYGNEIVPPKLYDSVCYVHDHSKNYYCLVMMDGEWGVSGQDGAMVIYPQFDEIKLDFNGFFEVELDGLKGAYSKTGEELVPLKYKMISIDYSSKLFKVKDEKGFWTPLDITFEEGVSIMKEEDGFVWRLKEMEGLCSAQDKNGKTIIGFNREYDQIWYDASDGGFFTVLKNGKMGVCSKSGEEKIPPVKYDIAYYVKDGSIEYYVVGNSGLYGVCNGKKQEIVEPKYNLVFYDKDVDCYFVRLNEKWGLCNNKGAEVIEPKYDKLSGSSYGFIWASDKGKQGAFDKKGKEIVSLNYEDVTYYSDGTFKTTNKDGELEDVGYYAMSSNTNSNVSSSYSTVSTRESRADKTLRVLNAVANALGAVSNAMNDYNSTYNPYSQSANNQGYTSSRIQNNSRNNNQSYEKRHQDNQEAVKRGEWMVRNGKEYERLYDKYYERICDVKIKAPSVRNMSPSERRKQVRDSQDECKRIMQLYKEKTGKTIPGPKDLLDWSPTTEELTGY